MSGALHLIVGAAEHGVTRHALAIAAACGHDVVATADPAVSDAVDRALDAAVRRGNDVVHVPFTDRLFGATVDEAAARFAALADRVAHAGIPLSVTLHDLPVGDAPLQERRRTLYRGVVRAAHGVVVNSRLELALLRDAAAHAHSLRVIALPLEPIVAVDPAEVDRARSAAPSATVLGFIYPDRGYDEVIAALPRGARLIAAGRAAAGHEDLLHRLAEAAARREVTWTSTGFLADDVFAAHVLAADVPIAPNRRITASGSINTWLAHGRRPLVPDSPYARELLRTRPQALTLYPQGGLADAITAALAQPGTTWLADGAARGPDVADVARAYRAHLASCAAPAPVRRARGGVTVPGNRFDLLGAVAPSEPPLVSVVVPYYDAQPQLDLVLTALAAQTHPRGRLEVVVADDGSRNSPATAAAGELPVRVVRQCDAGFRAARARNLGAALAGGDVLVFLDGDTVPEPTFVERLVALPAVCPDAVVVGRRQHADLTGWSPDRLAAWFAGTGPAPPRLDEPGWLADAYSASRNLLDADNRSYRYLISAVLAMSAQLFADVGGFDDRFVGYGGEDWDLAHRCWTAGAVFAHEPTAVAWHDGVDWAGRSGDDETARSAHRRQKEAEAAILAVLLPDRVARGPGQWVPYPGVVVSMSKVLAPQLLATARAMFAAGIDCGIWASVVTGPHAQLILADPRLHAGAPDDAVLARAWATVELHSDAAIADPADTAAELSALLDEIELHGQLDTPTMSVRSLRSVRRSARAAPAADEQTRTALTHLLFGCADRPGRGEQASGVAGSARRKLGVTTSGGT